jgi:hypothetical protein
MVSSELLLFIWKPGKQKDARACWLAGPKTLSNAKLCLAGAWAPEEVTCSSRPRPRRSPAPRHRVGVSRFTF